MRGPLLAMGKQMHFNHRRVRLRNASLLALLGTARLGPKRELRSTAETGDFGLGQGPEN